PISLLVALALLLVASNARADRSTIRNDLDHPSYVFEAEPHGVLAPFHHHGELGVGFQGTFNVADQGFIRRVNDSVGVGFGVNWLTHDHWLLSGAMQWNFWLSENWSVFGEPGVAIRTDKKVDVWPSLGAGGRFHFTRNFTLTMRVGFPVFGVGVSFLL
ncbi:MAG TPA: hypothetical protein VFZ53_33990, partial [Polyangiaceae bacterium]